MPLAPNPKPQNPRRIAIVGPESSGKSVLAEELAKYYKTVYVKEYSREYLNDLGREYNYKDILAIARGQYEKEQGISKKANNYLFCDTEFMVNMIWCQEKFGKCHPWIINMHESYPYDLYLLCKPDLPWEADPLREAPEEKERLRLFEVYLHDLEDRNLQFGIVEGSGSQRLDKAISIIGNKL